MLNLPGPHQAHLLYPLPPAYSGPRFPASHAGIGVRFYILLSQVPTQSHSLHSHHGARGRLVRLLNIFFLIFFCFHIKIFGFYLLYQCLSIICPTLFECQLLFQFYFRLNKLASILLIQAGIQYYILSISCLWFKPSHKLFYFHLTSADKDSI